MRDIPWDQCPAYARGLDSETNYEDTVVICTLDAHCDPQDETAEHYDSRLGIRWRYSDE